MVGLAGSQASYVRLVRDRRGAEGSPRRSPQPTGQRSIEVRPRIQRSVSDSHGTTMGILHLMTPGTDADDPQERRTSTADVATDDLDELVVRSGRGEEEAFAALYDALSPAVHGLTRRVVRDPAQAEEVTQEVFIDVWRSAPRFDRARGTARSWVLTIAHRRAVDRVRSAQASTDREMRAAQRSGSRDYDEVVEAVETRLEAQAVRKCLQSLTELQRESVNLAYYGGHTYAQVATVLSLPLGTVKTRLRDGLIRLRDCLGVTV